MGWLELILVFTILGYLYSRLQKRLRYFQDRGIPYVKPSFLSGQLVPFSGREFIGDTYRRIYGQLRRVKVGGFFQFLRPTYMIVDPALVNKLLVNEFSTFHSHGTTVDEKTNPLEGNLFGLDGEKWHALRKKLSPTFTSGKLKWMFQQMNVCGDSLMTALNQELPSSQEIEVRDLMARFTTDVIGSCAFGLEPESIKDKDCSFRRMGKRIFTPTPKQLLMFFFRLSFPKLFHYLKLTTIPRDISDFFYSLVRQTFEHRLKTGEKRNDFVQLLLELREKGSIEYEPKEMDDFEVVTLPEEKDRQNKLELTDDVLTAQAFVFFAAGFETSATSISLTLYQLAKNSKCQQTLREEIQTVKSRHDSRIDYDALKEMIYLEACISESLRMIPPIVGLSRAAANDNLLLDGVLVEKGAMIVIPIAAIQNDPEYFDAPGEFRPERFLPGEQRIPGTYAPFGDGPRTCIARRFAMLEIKLAISRVVESYRVSPSHKLQEPLNFQPRSFISVPVGGLWLRFDKITD